MKRTIRPIYTSAFAAPLMLLPNVATACVGAGVITRISGRAQDVVIQRSEAGGPRQAVARPRVLEVICVGDIIQAQNGAVVSLSMDGIGPVRVLTTPYTVAPRRNVTLASNAYRTVSEHLLPDMKRQPWDVHLRGGVPPLAFGVASLDGGGQKLTLGRSALLVRLTGGKGPFSLQLLGPSGGIIKTVSSPTPELALSGLNLSTGNYSLQAKDSLGSKLTGKFAVVAERPALSQDYQGVEDPEVKAAATAADLARVDPAIWAFEAEQILASSPASGLDRVSVYDLIESYTGE
jgi:hypothetical protein